MISCCEAVLPVEGRSPGLDEIIGLVLRDVIDDVAQQKFALCPVCNGRNDFNRRACVFEILVKWRKEEVEILDRARCLPVSNRNVVFAQASTPIDVGSQVVVAAIEITTGPNRKTVCFLPVDRHAEFTVFTAAAA